MTPGLPAAGSSLVRRLALTDRIFAGTRARHLVDAVDEGLGQVEEALARELRITDALADATSRYLYEAGGKRVRPMLAILAAQLGDGTTTAVVEGATAIELTHLGSLYHDDVMDSAPIRRGVPSAHLVWGNSVAILTGDLLFSRASQLVARQGENAIRRQADTFERLVLGQMHETVGPQPGEDPVAHYLGVLADKTGSLIAASAQSGILLSHAPDEFEQPMLAFGEKVGVAYQLADDVIDISAELDEAGKSAGTDLRAGVPTMPFLLLAKEPDAASQALRARIDVGVARIADGADPAILDVDLAELARHDVTARTRALAAAWADDAVASLAPLPDGPVREALERFARAVADRAG